MVSGYLVSIEKVGSNPLVLNRTLIFSPHFPFAFVTKIPKNANKDAGGAEGGFQGGIPPRPPHSAILSPFSGDSAIFAKLLRDLDSNQGDDFQRVASYH